MNAPPRQSKFEPARSSKRETRRYIVNGKWVDTRSPEFRAEARRQAALLDHSDDEKEGSALMRRLAQEAWDREG